MNPARRNFTIWLLCSGGVSLLSYVLAEYLLLPGVTYASTFRPTTADDFIVYYWLYTSTDQMKAMDGGPDCAYLARTGNTGAFTATALRRLLSGVIVSGGGDGINENPLFLLGRH